MELNELIYARAKLVCSKIGVPLKNADRNSKHGWEFKVEPYIIKQRQQAKILR